MIVDEVSDPPVKGLVVPAPATLADASEKAQPPVVTSKPEKQPEPVVETLKAEIKKPEPEVSKVAQPPTAKKPAKTVAKVESKPAKKAAKPPKEQAGGISWVIQTGSFQEKEKAYDQRNRIRKSRLAPTFIEKYTHKGQLRYRVRLGPFLSRKKATIVKNKLRAKYNIKAILMKYEK